MAFAKIVGLVVTPDTPRSRSAARLPDLSRSRLRSSSQTETPASRSLAIGSVITPPGDRYAVFFVLPPVTRATAVPGPCAVTPLALAGLPQARASRDVM